ncbi:unnamed protein product [Rhizophagus irregularis]|uniref:Uncharacterized protein n=1 Tax=Rhizophagus irregularis TaxID=588596 RepID=A0A2N1MRK5_9GLOM|nr:hypothetical protein RhiirC2_787754 [Rhizophagus irregularis]CAB5373426.1 unnamed protein product [Rhizophagus irregularis]
MENTKGHLSEISLFYNDYIYDYGIKKIIQAIYQNCPNLKYFKLSYNIELLILELENLLINYRNPMLLKLNIRDKEIKQQLEDLVEEYKVRGVIKKYSIGHSKININEDFDWN